MCSLFCALVQKLPKVADEAGTVCCAGYTELSCLPQMECELAPNQRHGLGAYSYSHVSWCGLRDEQVTSGGEQTVLSTVGWME